MTERQSNSPPGSADRANGRSSPDGGSCCNGGHAAAGGEPASEIRCRWQESIALHLLGALSPRESIELDEHLTTECPACTAELDGVSHTLAELDLAEIASMPEASLPKPSPQLRARLVAKVADESKTRKSTDPARTWQRWKNVPTQSSPGAMNPGLATIAAAEDTWESTGMKGVTVKPLFVDAERRFVSMLVRMEPGSSYPGHRHAGNEECFVVSGDIKVGERVLHAGDYQVAEEGSIHGVQSTEEGCVLFIVSSQDDELVDGAR
jgi:anti-sigma factor ChrR (cupin superfamily)